MAGNLSKFLQCRPSIFFYRLVGWRITRWMIFLLGKVHFMVNFKSRRKITMAVHQAVGAYLPKSGRSLLNSKVFDGIFSHYYEKLYIAYEAVPKATRFLKKSISPDGLQVLRNKICSGNGVLVITGHYGAIEYIPAFLAVHGFPVTMIARFKTEQLKKKCSLRPIFTASGSWTPTPRGMCLKQRSRN